MSDRIAVVVVNRDTRELLRECLHSVRAERPAETVVVDHASSDGSAEMVRSRFPDARLLSRRDNPGFGAGANAGIDACHAPHLLLLNADTRLRRGALEALARELDRHPQAALVGPRLIGADGRRQPSCFPFPTPFNFLVLNSWLNRAVRALPGVRRRFRPAWSEIGAGPVPWVLGAAMAMRRTAVRAVGGFDEGFFMYSEEVDLCWRLRGAGWEVRYTPEAEVFHLGGASTRQARAGMLVQQVDSLERFYRLHLSPGALARLRFVLGWVMLEWIARDALKSRLARDPDRRRSLEEDLEVWRSLLRAQIGAYLSPGASEG
jgi:N-acetylglucosaminyl-diphospho-decaprenol L-rhamnosyltransferase